MKAQRSILAAVAAFGLVGAGAALKSGTPNVSAAPAGIPTDGSVADVAEKVVDSVVTISVKGEQQQSGFDMDMLGDPFDMGGGSHVVEGKGSGVIVTANGRILTNAHVVNGFSDIKVTLPDGTDVDAKVVGKDPKVDLAVIQLKGQFPPLKPIAWGDSTNLRLGDIVLAIGDGMDVGKSVSMGIVSAKNRHFGNKQRIEEYEDFIQTDATVNPGNSGGALVNLKGELVGINTAIASRSGGSQGIGFAIPANMARPIMEMLVKDGKVTRGYLGVNIGTVTPSVAKEYKLGTTSGVAVGGVQKGGPAALAHLVEGDVIVALDGKAVREDDVLRTQVALTKPGTNVDLDVVHRDGSRGKVTVKLGEMPEEQPVAQGQMPQGFQVPPGYKCH
jgi:S1-C subfamily serine protease